MKITRVLRQFRRPAFVVTAILGFNGVNVFAGGPLDKNTDPK
jgi:hypothetical protein